MRIYNVTVVALFFDLALHANWAVASPMYPGDVQMTFGLAAPPNCTLCHTSEKGGLGTANTLVGKYLRNRGLVAGDEKALAGALAAMEGEQHDADDDGVTDVDELKRGTDPNTIESADTGPVEPIHYGCASIARGSSSSAMGGALFALGSALFLARRAMRRLRR